MKKAVSLSPKPLALCAALVIAIINHLVVDSATLAFAGPVERELRARGDDVGFPTPRPTPEKTGQSVDTTAAGPPNRSKDGKIRRRPRTPMNDTVQNPRKSALKVIGTSDTKTTDTQSKPSACFQALKQIAEVKRVSSPEANDPACTIEDPVVMTQTRSARPVRFNKNLTLDCSFALALAKFVGTTTQQLARHHLGIEIEKIHSGEGFVCRRRNNAPTGKLSEHSFGNATDWIGFTFVDGSRLAIRSTDDMNDNEAAFLDGVRAAACETFTTVLGPGSNAAHSSHFHFDLGRSKGRKNPYRICE